jgi:hypothetical protein
MPGGYGVFCKVAEVDFFLAENVGFQLVAKSNISHRGIIIRFQ